MIIIKDSKRDRSGLYNSESFQLPLLFIYIIALISNKSYPYTIFGWRKIEEIRENI